MKERRVRGSGGARPACGRLSPPARLLVERDETGGVRGSDPRPSVANRLVRDRELAEVVTDHLGLDLHSVHGLA